MPGQLKSEIRKKHEYQFSTSAHMHITETLTQMTIRKDRKLEVLIDERF